ncbi:MAG: UDP-N-acetylmuramoyl-L-alanine--D-glutamate ligase, partial [Candidatus Eremiobacteraeota bacterium]|nr:UDP-N-acetylmuramoyl-L-alanine--D-glutamate ligase [Candidatus Eremiobacteraeota bacterium]
RTIASKLGVAVISPGVPLTSAVARSLPIDVPVFSEIEVAYRLCKAPIIAVTGTKGKSTTTALIGHLLRSAGKTVRVGGNIGNPLIYEAIEATAADWVVAEVSSFQLETIRSFKPRVSVVLNISADHLDRYFSIEEYVEAKFRIFANQNAEDTFVGNLDDEWLAALPYRFAERTAPSPRMLWFATGERHERAQLFLESQSIFYADLHGNRPRELLKRADIPLLGVHNAQNAMAAMLAAIAAGVEPDALPPEVASFRPMAHRLEVVPVEGSVTYVDDSKATNPGAVIAALRSFDRPVILIAGGKAKGTDFTEMGRVISARAKLAILIGEAADEIAATIDGPRVLRASSMEDAVQQARSSAVRNDIVLLSPGCASFDMFLSAEDRGERFAAAAAAQRETADA